MTINIDDVKAPQADDLVGPDDGGLMDRLLQQKNALFGWIAAWENADYSWEGLKNKYLVIPLTLRNGRYGQVEISYQKIFRDERDNLISDGRGKYYTKYHLPLLLAKNNYDSATEFHGTAKIYWPKDQWITLGQELGLLREKLKRLHLSELVEDDLTAAIDPNVPPPPLDIPLDGMTLWEATPSTNMWLQGPVNRLPGDVPSGLAIVGDVRLQDCLGDLTTNGAVFFGDFKVEHSTLKNFRLSGSSLSILKIENSEIGALVADCEICNFVDSSTRYTKINTLNIRGSGTKYYHLLGDASFINEILFDEEIAGEVMDVDYRRYCLEMSGYRRGVPLAFYSDAEKKILSKHLAKIESAVHMIKTSLGDKPKDFLTNRFYRYDLWARGVNPSSDAGFRFVSGLFRFTSNYGFSIMKPLQRVAESIVLCAVVYMLIYTSSQNWEFRTVDFSCFEHFDQALSMSMSRAAPILQWDLKDGPVEGSFGHVLRTLDGTGGVIAHATAILQTLATTALLFLSGLAAKRRFKVEK